MTQAPPNMLLVLQDQLRFDVVHSRELCHTPAQDRLRRQGTAFLDHYAPLGICSPSRASLLTGRYPHSNGVLNNLNNPDALVDRLPPENVTVAQALRSAGYRTGYVGKWHLGRDHGPGTRGFDDSRALDEYGPFMARQHRSQDVVTTRYEPSNARYDQRFARHTFPIYSTAVVPEEEIPARVLAEQSIDLLRGYATGDAPFFLVVSFLEPHWPNVLAEPYASMYDPADLEPWPNFDDSFEGKPGALRAGLEHFGVSDFTWEDWAPIVASYLGAVSLIDDVVGRVVTALDDLGLADDTLVVASTDHGDMTGAHRQFNKGPLMYEEVYHVPFLVRWPGVAPADATVDELTSHVDVMPTFLDAASIAGPDDIQGRSLLPLLSGDRAGWRDSLMCEFHGDEFGLYSQRMLRHDRYKLIYNAHDVRELYDLDADPHELRNLAYEPEYADVRQDLEIRLLEQMHDLEDPLRQLAVNTLG